MLHTTYMYVWAVFSCTVSKKNWYSNVVENGIFNFFSLLLYIVFFSCFSSLFFCKIVQDLVSQVLFYLMSMIKNNSFFPMQTLFVHRVKWMNAQSHCAFLKVEKV